MCIMVASAECYNCSHLQFTSQITSTPPNQTQEDQPKGMASKTIKISVLAEDGKLITPQQPLRSLRSVLHHLKEHLLLVLLTALLLPTQRTGGLGLASLTGLALISLVMGSLGTHPPPPFAFLVRDHLAGLGSGEVNLILLFPERSLVLGGGLDLLD